MELRHLRYFVAVAEELHFGAAAERLGIAPPTLSVQIKQLEEILGAALFFRSKRKVRLTQAGELFLQEAHGILASAERALQVARLAGRGEIGHIALGYVSSALWSGVLGQMITAFKQQIPQVSLTPREEPMAALPQRVADGLIDVAFARGPMRLPEGVRAIILHRDIFCLALPSAHPLAALEVAVDPKQLMQDTFIVPEQSSGTDEVARRGGFITRRRLSPGSLVEVLTRVAFNEGIAVIPDSLSQAITLPGVVFRLLSGPKITSQIILLARRWERTPAIVKFISFAEGYAQSRCPQAPGC